MNKPKFRIIKYGDYHFFAERRVWIFWISVEGGYFSNLNLAHEAIYRYIRIKNRIAREKEQKKTGYKITYMKENGDEI